MNHLADRMVVIIAGEPQQRDDVGGQVRGSRKHSIQRANTNLIHSGLLPDIKDDSKSLASAERYKGERTDQTIVGALPAVIEKRRQRNIDRDPDEAHRPPRLWINLLIVRVARRKVVARRHSDGFQATPSICFISN